MTTKHKRATIVNSEAVRKQAAEKRIGGPIALKGVSEGKLIQISPSMYKKLDIDPSYQRGEQKAEINSLITAIQNGGHVPDPVTLARRQYGDDESRWKLWIIDGQQRSMAFMRLDRTFPALVYDVDSIEAERNFFLVMNTRQDVGAANFVKSWPGPSAQMIRAVNAQEGHPLFGRCSFKGGTPGKLTASIVAKGLMSAACGKVSGRGDIQSTLGRIDDALNKSVAAKERCRMFLQLLGLVFSDYAKTMPVQALGLVAYERWASKPAALPAASVIRSLSLINWANLCQSSSARFRPVFEAAVKQRWKS